MTICLQMKKRNVTDVAVGWFIRSFKSNNHESSPEFALFCTFCQKFCHLSERAKTVVNAQIEILDVRDKGKDTIQGHFTFKYALRDLWKPHNKSIWVCLTFDPLPLSVKRVPWILVSGPTLLFPEE